VDKAAKRIKRWIKCQRKVDKVDKEIRRWIRR